MAVLEGFRHRQLRAQDAMGAKREEGAGEVVVFMYSSVMIDNCQRETSLQAQASKKNSQHGSEVSAGDKPCHHDRVYFSKHPSSLFLSSHDRGRSLRCCETLLYGATVNSTSTYESRDGGAGRYLSDEVLTLDPGCGHATVTSRMAPAMHSHLAIIGLA